jgi:hypothetical protein
MYLSKTLFAQVMDFLPWKIRSRPPLVHLQGMRTRAKDVVSLLTRESRSN